MKQVLNLIDKEIAELSYLPVVAPDCCQSNKLSGRYDALLQLKQKIESLPCDCNRGKKRVYCHQCGKVLCLDCSNGSQCKECAY